MYYVAIICTFYIYGNWTQNLWYQLKTTQTPNSITHTNWSNFIMFLIPQILLSNLHMYLVPFELFWIISTFINGSHNVLILVDIFPLNSLSENMRPHINPHMKHNLSSHIFEAYLWYNHVFNYLRSNHLEIIGTFFTPGIKLRTSALIQKNPIP